MEWFQRASTVIPGGIYGHTSPAAGLPGVFPMYAESASGCRFKDIDGKEYIDFMCAFGPIVLGYHVPEIEEAAAKQRQKGNLFNIPGTAMVELAEKLVERIDFADWTVFAKNGSDVTTWALQVAREATGRKKVLMIKGAYHGVDAWCTPGYGGVIEEDRMHVHTFPWNDLAAFETAVGAYDSDLAAVIVTPYHHPGFRPSEMPQSGFLSSLQKICNARGIVFILDDIRVGFRLHEGGSHRVFGFEPDIACYCKALGNGYPISAAVGRDSLKTQAAKVFLTGSYWNNADAMAAASVCLDLIRDRKVPEQLERIGDRLCRGLSELAANYGYQLDCTGPRAAPYPFFQGDSNLKIIQKFCTYAVKGGAYFHPHHNWFLSAAHGENDIDEALAIAEQAFEKMRDEDGKGS